MKLNRCSFLFAALLTACQQGPSVLDTKGHIYGLEALRGKWVLVNYWAAWCPSCVHEIPELNRFSQSIQGKNVVLLSVNYDDLPKAELNRLQKELKISYPILTTDPKNYYGVQDISGLPTTIVINPKGEVEGSMLGGQTFAGLQNYFSKQGIA